MKDESNDADKDFVLDEPPLEPYPLLVQSMAAEAAFVDVLSPVVMHRVADDVVAVAKYPVHAGVGGHTFYSVDSPLATMNLIPAAVSYAVIVDATKHVCLFLLLLQQLLIVQLLTNDD